MQVGLTGMQEVDPDQGMVAVVGASDWHCSLLLVAYRTFDSF